MTGNHCQASTNHGCYTLSHPENGRDATERARGYTLQDTSFMRQSRCSFLNAWENTHFARAITSAFPLVRANVTVVLDVRQSIDLSFDPITNELTWIVIWHQRRPTMHLLWQVVLPYLQALAHLGQLLQDQITCFFRSVSKPFMKILPNLCLSWFDGLMDGLKASGSLPPMTLIS